MMQKCQDGYYVTFSSLLSLEDYNKEQEAHTKWTRCPVNALKVNALDKASPLYVNTSAFASEVTSDAIEDTTENLGLLWKWTAKTILSVTQPTKACLTGQKSAVILSPSWNERFWQRY